MAQDNIYAAPKAQPTEQQRASVLLQRQSMAGIIIGSFSAAIPCCLLHMILLYRDQQTLVFYLFSGFVIGLTARYCGQAVTWQYQIWCGIITAILVIAVHFMSEYTIGIFYSLPSVLIATFLAKKRLTKQENIALSQWQSQKGQ